MFAKDAGFGAVEKERPYVPVPKTPYLGTASPKNNGQPTGSDYNYLNRKNTGGTAVASSGGDAASSLASQYEARQSAARDALMSAARSNYQSAVNQLNANYNANRTQVNEDTGKSLQEAYVNRMMSERNLDQQLAASGRSGGASETTRLGISNNYGTTRGKLDTARNQQLAQLALALQNSIAQQQQSLNTLLAQYEANYQTSMARYGY